MLKKLFRRIVNSYDSSVINYFGEGHTDLEMLARILKVDVVELYRCLKTRDAKELVIKHMDVKYANAIREILHATIRKESRRFP